MNWRTSSLSLPATSFGEPLAMMRPPESRWQQSATAVISRTSCDTTMLVTPSVSLRRRMSRSTTPIEIGSRPTKGSS